MKYATLRRGQANTSDLIHALDELGVGSGEDFAVVPLGELTGDIGKRGPDNGRTTSRAAAVANAPRRGTQRHRVLQTIASNGRDGATRDQIAAARDLPPNVVGPRVLELIRGGYAYETGQTRATRAGEQATIVYASPSGIIEGLA